MSIVPETASLETDHAFSGHPEPDLPAAAHMPADQPDPPLTVETQSGHTDQSGHAESDHASADDAEPDHTRADESADAMKDRLRKDVASWREGRSDGSSRAATDLSVAVARSIVPPTTARMKRAKPAPPDVKPTITEKKPFGMSYDGTSRADYIKLMISRGAR